ncbi:MAG: hypothetical protein R3C19_12860 [Planctomycetaceae bacterium]
MALILAAVSGIGCQQQEDFVDYGSAPASESTAGGHSHPSEGPHHGDLVELGDEEYHAEVVHDDEAETVTVFILDSAAKQQVAVDAADLKINVSHDGTPEQFALAAEPDASDAEGKSSRFVSSDSELAEHLDQHDAEPKLVVMIGGKSYSGVIRHAHDHGDEHAEDDHAAGHSADGHSDSADASHEGE